MPAARKLSKQASSILIYALGLVCVALLYRSSLPDSCFNLYIVLVIAYIWIAGLMLIAAMLYDLYMFEPFFIVGALYLAIFVFKPLIDLNSSDRLVAHGIDVTDGGIKATVIVVLSFTFFFIGYYIKKDVSMKKFFNESPEEEKSLNLEEINENNLSVNTLYISWFIVFAMCIFCMITQGVSLSYIFSFGTEGSFEESTDSALTFLSNFGITLVILTVMILYRSKNIPLKLFVLIFTVVYILMRNSRWIVLAFILSMAAYHYIKKKKSPNGLVVLVLGFLALTIFAWMQVNRNILATGGAMQGWGEGGFTLEKLVAPLESDLNTYKTFYSMVLRFPSAHEYMWGLTFAYTFLLFIPRAIWSGKPDNPVRDMIGNSLNQSAKTSGTAVASIGEMYANFGVLGCFSLMFVFGFILSRVKKLLFTKNDDTLFMYCIVFSILFQWVARGNFSGNFYMTFFAVLPFILNPLIRWALSKSRVRRLNV